MTGAQWLLLIGTAAHLLLTGLLLIACGCQRRPKSKMLAAAYRRFSSSGALPVHNQRLRLNNFSTKQRLTAKRFAPNKGCVKLLVLAVLVIRNVVCLGLLLSRAPGEPAVESTSTRSATPGGLSSSAGSVIRHPRSGSAEGETIQLEDLADSAKPFQPVRIQGTYRGGGHTFLRVQRGREASGWTSRTHEDRPVGPLHRLCRVWAAGSLPASRAGPHSGLTSKPFVLVITG